MPRSKGVPSYRHHKPSGQAVVTIHARDVYLGAFGSPESQERYARLLADAAAGRPVERRNGNASAPVTAEVVERFKAHVSRAYGMRSNEADHYQPLLHLLVNLHGTSPVADFGPRDLRRIREQLIAEGRVRK